MPCERAGGIRAQQPLEASREREHSGGDVRGLPWRGARDISRRPSAVTGESRQHTRDLRAVPRTEIPDGVKRAERAAVYFVPGERSRARGGERFAEGRGMHGLPRDARDSPGQRCAIAGLQIQRAGHMRQVPYRYCRHVYAEYSRAGDRARQRAGAGVHGLPRDSLDQGAGRSELAGFGNESVTRHLRALPRRGAVIAGVWRARQPRDELF